MRYISISFLLAEAGLLIRRVAKMYTEKTCITFTEETLDDNFKGLVFSNKDEG